MNQFRSLRKVALYKSCARLSAISPIGPSKHHQIHVVIMGRRHGNDFFQLMDVYPVSNSQGHHYQGTECGRFETRECTSVGPQEPELEQTYNGATRNHFFTSAAAMATNKLQNRSLRPNRK